MKNIRQAYNELETRYNELAEAHLTLQRTLKRILLTRKAAGVPTCYTYNTAQYYTDRELDEMQIVIEDNKNEERVELSI